MIAFMPSVRNLREKGLECSFFAQSSFLGKRSLDLKFVSMNFREISSHLCISYAQCSICNTVTNGVHLAVVGDVHKLFTCNNDHMIIESFVESASIDFPTILALIYPNAGFPILPDRCSYPFKVMKSN
jgi:hypothetical protein